VLGELMGWPTTATVCAAEGHRGGRQRGFTATEVTRLAGIFGVSPEQLTTLCANCGGRPPAGFACLTCGADLFTDGAITQIHQAACGKPRTVNNNIAVAALIATAGVGKNIVD
jgi:hypothetical protein